MHCREECNNLVDLIQSRVIDSDEQPISCEKDKTPPPNLGSSFLSPKFLSLGSSPYHTRNLEYTAINEAKKWLDAEKSPEGGPRMLNTNQLVGLPLLLCKFIYPPHHKSYVYHIAHMLPFWNLFFSPIIWFFWWFTIGVWSRNRIVSCRIGQSIHEFSASKELC